MEDAYLREDVPCGVGEAYCPYCPPPAPACPSLDPLAPAYVIPDAATLDALLEVNGGGGRPHRQPSMPT